MSRENKPLPPHHLIFSSVLKVNVTGSFNKSKSINHLFNHVKSNELKARPKYVRAKHFKYEKYIQKIYKDQIYR